MGDPFVPNVTHHPVNTNPFRAHPTTKPRAPIPRDEGYVSDYDYESDTASVRSGRSNQSSRPPRPGDTNPFADEGYQDKVSLRRDQDPKMPKLPKIDVPTEDEFLSKTLGDKAPKSGKIENIDDKALAKTVHDCAQQELEKIEGARRYIQDQSFKAEDDARRLECEVADSNLAMRKKALEKYSETAEKKSLTFWGNVEQKLGTTMGQMFMMVVLPIILQELGSAL